MIKRVLLAVLLAWMAIAPAIATSCAAGCETGGSLMHHASDGSADTNSQDLADCHGAAGDRDDSNMPDGGSMQAACLVAGGASLPSSSIALEKIDLVSEQHSAVLLPPHSFQTSAPARPPQA